LPEDATTPKDRWVSVLELPGAAAQPWYATRADVPALLATRHQFLSTVLNSEREVVVYTPPGYLTTGPAYPTLYLFDGEDPDGLVFASATVSNLIHAGKIPPLVVVRIVNPSQTVRQRELSCLPSFATFLTNELIPFVRRTYHVSTDPQKTGIGGYSLGGLAAAYAGFTHSETFGLVLAQSGSFWFEPTGADESEFGSYSFNSSLNQLLTTRDNAGGGAESAVATLSRDGLALVVVACGCCSASSRRRVSRSRAPTSSSSIRAR
jgi:enterochelin esterase family protein